MQKPSLVFVKVCSVLHKIWATVQAYCHTIKITNTLEAAVEATIRPGSPERYSLSPTAINLKPGECACVDVRLRILKYAAKRKAVEQGQKDIFHIKVIHDKQLHQEIADCNACHDATLEAA